jgi:hypothetical protein
MDYNFRAEIIGKSVKASSHVTGLKGLVETESAKKLGRASLVWEKARQELHTLPGLLAAWANTN